MKILITGSRGWTDRNKVEHAIKNYGGLENSVIIVHGGAVGADSIANSIAKSYGLVCHVHYPNWNKFGKKAGIIRNEEMLLKENPDVVLAFWDRKSPGTKHMMDFATSQGYEVIQI